MGLRTPLPQYWARFGWAMLMIAGVGAVLLYLVPDAAGLLLFGIYSTPSNSLVPIPHEPGLLFVAKYYHPVWIALAGTVGTGVAAAIDYPVIRSAFRLPTISKARDSRIYRAAVKWLMRYPFATIVVFAATPLPVYVVRILAPASGYPIGRYVAAMMVGRFPRYYVVALFGFLVPIPTWALVALFVAMVAPFLLGARMSRSRSRRASGLDILEASGNSLPSLGDDVTDLLTSAPSADTALPQAD